MKLFKHSFQLIIFLVSVAFYSSSAEAVIIQYDFNGGGFVSRNSSGVTNSFSFLDTKITLDASHGSAGNLTFSGTVRHNQSGEIWNITGANTNLINGPVYPTVIDDILAGLTNLRWDDVNWSITPTILNPTYTDDRDWFGRKNGMPGMYTAILYNSGGRLRYSNWYNQASGPIGDIHNFTINGTVLTPPIPEPSTYALLGIGLIGALVGRKRFSFLRR